MSEARYIELVESVIDFSNAVEAACVNLRRQIQGYVKVERKPSWNPDAIKWVEAEGFRGKYERSEDVNSLDFKALVKDLAAHNGKLSRNGFFYWLFKNGATVGRKKREVKT